MAWNIELPPGSGSGSGSGGEGEGRVTDCLVGVSAVLSPAGLLGGGGALSPRHHLALLLQHSGVLGGALDRGSKKGISYTTDSHFQKINQNIEYLLLFLRLPSAHLDLCTASPQLWCILHPAQCYTPTNVNKVEIPRLD